VDFGNKILKAKVSDEEDLILKSEQPADPKEKVTIFKVFSPQKPKPIKIIDFHKDKITDFLFSSNKKHFFVSSEDKTISI
jgi:WD domain, G-beta repeat.